MIRTRTQFPAGINFSGWWIKSKKGIIAQLDKCGSSIREEILYHLVFNDGLVETGNGIWTTEMLTEAGANIRRTHEELKTIKNENKAKPIPVIEPAQIIVRPRRIIRRR